jgi:hypothetical protein
MGILYTNYEGRTRLTADKKAKQSPLKPGGFVKNEIRI